MADERGSQPAIPQGVPILFGQPAPRLYTNSFQVAATNADIVLELRHLGVQVAIVSMSFALAKTLHQTLGGIIQNIETKLGKEIPTTDEFDRAFQIKKTT
jgi:hypothetical protein